MISPIPDQTYGSREKFGSRPVNILPIVDRLKAVDSWCLYVQTLYWMKYLYFKIHKIY